ncbi:hypothetical protein GUJ93_ZPchr0006g45702 [Zizania palustris]|uniref:Uncharacterized protein n=1 Tax=Zizania palustris TaxID=103762 RepID=A0A8J5S8W8_ZIZPA|nr:hypothetical protein GUJ93_ZPchr0006g45702 [Zizania palustris]
MRMQESSKREAEKKRCARERKTAAHAGEKKKQLAMRKPAERGEKSISVHENRRERMRGQGRWVEERRLAASGGTREILAVSAQSADPLQALAGFPPPPGSSQKTVALSIRRQQRRPWPRGAAVKLHAPGPARKQQSSCWRGRGRLPHRQGGGFGEVLFSHLSPHSLFAGLLFILFSHSLFRQLYFYSRQWPGSV